MRTGIPIDVILQAAAIPISVGFLAGDFQVYSRACILRGWSIGEAAGTPAQSNVELYDGVNANSQFLARIDMPASTSSVEWFSGEGVQVKWGIRAHAITGLCVGVVYILPLL